MPKNLINHACVVKPPLKTQKEGFQRAARLVKQNSSTCHHAGLQTPEDWRFLVLDLTLWISSSGCWFMWLHILSSKPHICHVADRVLVLQPSVRPEPLRWQSWVQDIGAPETSQPHVISISESTPRDLHLKVKTKLNSTVSKLQCWMPMPNN